MILQILRNCIHPHCTLKQSTPRTSHGGFGILNVKFYFGTNYEDDPWKITCFMSPPLLDRAIFSGFSFSVGTAVSLTPGSLLLCLSCLTQKPRGFLCLRIVRYSLEECLCLFFPKDSKYSRVKYQGKCAPTLYTKQQSQQVRKTHPPSVTIHRPIDTCLWNSYTI